jgi:ubiquinone/menaquinone biosynthesis C-methylase UbiE
MSSSPALAAPTVNHWSNARCAKAFWTQNELPPYRQLLRDTAEWLDPAPGERWLDLGCGGGQLTRTLWEKSGGTVGEIVALDCAAANEAAIAKVRRHLRPAASVDRVRFLHQDFSAGLAACPDSSFDGAVSGLAIQYAESFSTERGCWTTDAYDHLLTEILRVLRPGGRFVFSVNIPEPAWIKIALYGIPAFFTSRKPLRYFRNAMRMLRYGAWLKEEARRGRFHYLPASAIVEKLTAIGFLNVETRLSFARQAFVVRCQKSVEIEWLTPVTGAVVVSN